jgi:hypothetical protein
VEFWHLGDALENGYETLGKTGANSWTLTLLPIDRLIQVDACG